jgi:hypothetical protein
MKFWDATFWTVLLLLIKAMFPTRLVVVLLIDFLHRNHPEHPQNLIRSQITAPYLANVGHVAAERNFSMTHYVVGCWWQQVLSATPPLINANLCRFHLVRSSMPHWRISMTPALVT